MAQDAVDAAVARMGAPGADAPRCRTARLPLVGAGRRGRSLDGVPARLVRRYGTEAPDVAALAHGRPELLEPIAEGLPTLRVELLFGALHEGALTVDDLLDRRTRLGLVAEDRERALDAAREALAEAQAASPTAP